MKKTDLACATSIHSQEHGWEDGRWMETSSLGKRVMFQREQRERVDGLESGRKLENNYTKQMSKKEHWDTEKNMKRKGCTSRILGGGGIVGMKGCRRGGESRESEWERDKTALSLRLILKLVKWAKPKGLFMHENKELLFIFHQMMKGKGLGGVSRGMKSEKILTIISCISVLRAL